jgi:hypothetical protein
VIRRATALFLLASLGGAVSCRPRVTTIGAAGTDANAAPDASTHLDASIATDSATAVNLGQYIEAESGVLEGGYVVADDPAASHGQFIHPDVGASSEDGAGPARARYELFAAEAGTYLVWGRIHGQNISENRFWFQVDDGTWYKERVTTGDVWFWDGLHDNLDYGTPIAFTLSAGTHRLVIANCVDGVGLDRLYYTPDKSHPEGDATKCNPPHSIELSGECNPSCGSRGGSCGGPPCEGLPSFATYDCAACCLPEQ